MIHGARIIPTLSGYWVVPDSGALEVAMDISPPGVEILFTNRSASVLENATEAVSSVSNAGIAVVRIRQSQRR